MAAATEDMRALIRLQCPRISVMSEHKLPRTYSFFPYFGSFVSALGFGLWQGSVGAVIFVWALLVTLIDVIDDAVGS